MELSKVIKERRSVRQYSDKPVPREVVTEILEHAIWAPSATNLQPWYFVVINSKEARDSVLRNMDSAAEEFKPYIESRFPEHEDVRNHALNFVRSLGNAPVIILAFLLKDYSEKIRFSCEQSVAAAIQNMLLKSHDMGLHSCWLTASTFVKHMFEQQFGKDKGAFMGLVTIGYGEQPKYAPGRRDGRYEFV